MQLLKHLKSPQLIGLDSMNLWITHKPKSLRRLMKMVHLFVANDSEARALTGENNLIMAAKRRLRSMGPRMMVIKKGEHGVLFHSDR
jgi:sugar/nucleoside kinase (ribokinase family)